MQYQHARVKVTTKETIIKILKLPPSSNESEQTYLCIEHYKVIHRSLPENKEQYDHSISIGVLHAGVYMNSITSQIQI